MKDFSYLIEDLRPELIVLDSKTASEYLNAFKVQYDASELLQSLPFIFIDEEIPGIKNVLGIITRPFDPFTITEKLQSFLSN